MATEISVLRSASVPVEIYVPVLKHARNCIACIRHGDHSTLTQDTRWCSVAEGIIERALQLFIRPGAR